MEKDYSKDEAVVEARRLVEDAADGPGRLWLVSEVSCYGNSDYTTTTHTLEGSPARGYVIDMQHGRNHGVVVVYDMLGERLARLIYTP
jgi:hypothetical protein